MLPIDDTTRSRLFPRGLSSSSTMSTAMRCGSESLPYELIEKIISELAERDRREALEPEARKTLMNCSLVNRAFRISSQSHLFWFLDMSSHRSTDRASKLLNGSEHIRGMVRSLSLPYENRNCMCRLPLRILTSSVVSSTHVNEWLTSLHDSAWS